MLEFSETVFNDTVQGTDPIYSDPCWNEPMGSPDAIFIGYIASQSGGTTPTLSIGFETSLDGHTWGDWAGPPPVINAKALSTTGATREDPARRYQPLHPAPGVRDRALVSLRLTPSQLPRRAAVVGVHDGDGLSAVVEHGPAQSQAARFSARRQTL